MYFFLKYVLTCVLLFFFKSHSLRYTRVFYYLKHYLYFIIHSLPLQISYRKNQLQKKQR
jgi:hypothetical protein